MSFLFFNIPNSLRPTLQAWKKRWFILRSGRMSGDPDVLEYYKNDHSKKPIRVIDLHCCEQVDAGLTFKRKEFQGSFVFDIKTSDRTFYLVAETEDEMNQWVRSICQLCGFNQSDNNHGRQRFTYTWGFAFVFFLSRSMFCDLSWCFLPFPSRQVDNCLMSHYY